MLYPIPKHALTRVVGMARALLTFGLCCFAHAAISAHDPGEALYLENCSACHGDNGQGGMGVPLSLPSFLATASDLYLKKTIRHGRPGRMMPAFAGLEPGQVEAVVAHIRGWHGKPAPTYSADAISGDPGVGGTLFANHCAACHGQQGEGGKGTGVTLSRPRELPILAPALSNSGFLASASDGMIRRIIAEGRSDTPMPGFGDTLEQSQLNDLVAFIRAFALSPVDKRREADDATATLVVESPYSFEQTIHNLTEAIVGNNMRVLGQLSHEKGLVEKNLEDKTRIHINTCRFSRLDAALKIDPRFGVLLPCRISVAETDGRVSLYAANPLWFARVFNNIALQGILADMHGTYVEILEEAAF